MRWLSLAEVLELHRRLIQQSGGAFGLRDLAMEVVMVLNGLELRADVDASEAVVLAVASGTMDRSALARWLTAHQCPCGLD
jgi:prophage maintenance system killer protein